MLSDIYFVQHLTYNCIKWSRLNKNNFRLGQEQDKKAFLRYSKCIILYTRWTQSGIGCNNDQNSFLHISNCFIEIMPSYCIQYVYSTKCLWGNHVFVWTLFSRYIFPLKSYPYVNKGFVPIIWTAVRRTALHHLCSLNVCIYCQAVAVCCKSTTSADLNCFSSPHA